MRNRVNNTKFSVNRLPHLAAVLVSNNGSSETYVASKVKNCAEISFQSTLIRLEETVSEKELLNEIFTLNGLLKYSVPSKHKMQPYKICE